MADNTPYDYADICEYIDREAIRDVLYRYARGIDRCDVELLRGVYWPDAIDDHMAFVGKPEEFIAWVMSILGTMSVTQHFIGNILIRLEGTSAQVEAYFDARHRMEADGKPARDFVMAGRYLDRMEKRQNEWRVAHRVVVFDFLREYDDSGDWTNPKNFPAPERRVLGQRTPHDPSDALFGGSLMRAPFSGTRRA